MLKTLAASFVMSFALSASLMAQPVQLDWEEDPFHWEFRDGGVETRRQGESLLPVKSESRYGEVTFAARVTPLKSEVKEGLWSTLGLAVRSDNANFWALSIVRGPKGERFVELGEMRTGRWCAQYEDGLPRHDAAGTSGLWREGETYSLEISFTPDRVRGTVCDGAGKMVMDRTFETKGRPCVIGGAPALRRTGRIAGRFASLRCDCARPLPPRPVANESVPPYACDNFARGVAGRATGFFHTEEIGGRSWVIDPLGRGYVACGCDHISYHAAWSKRAGKSYHREANDRLFRSHADWASTTVRRLLDWGFNQLGAGSDPALRHRGLSHTVFLSMGDTLCFGDDDECYILKNECRPCSAFPNVFHPEFAAFCRSIARRMCRPSRNDPWLYGYYLDNEFRWWGHGDLATGLFDDVAKLRPNHSARLALGAYLEKSVPGGRAAFAKLSASEQLPHKRGFLRLCAVRYFETCRNAILAEDPNHMILGARFAGLKGADDVVWEVAGRYSEIVTFNCYPWCDLNRGAVYTWRGANERLLEDAFAERFAVVKKPLQITEWSFPALDAGLPCFAGAGQRMPTQRERVRATELCAKTFLALPFVVGYDYFMWADQAPEGVSDEFPEDSNYGLLNIRAEPYPELTGMFTRIQKDVARWRFAAPPRPGPIPKGVVQTAEQAWAFAARKQDVKPVFTASGDSFSLEAGSLRLSGCRGGKYLVSSFRKGGCEFGPVYAMISVREPNGSRGWYRTEKVTDFSWDGSGKVLAVKATGGASGKSAFSISSRFRIAGDRVMCEFTELGSVGRDPLDAYEVFISVHSPFAAECASAENVKEAPNQWRTESRTGWRAKDGRRVDVFTRSPMVAGSFRYWATPNGGVHPDGMFNIPGSVRGKPLGIPPGTVKSLEGTCWAWIECSR